MVAFPVYIFRKGLRRIPSPAKLLQACELYLLDQYAKLTLMEDTSWEQRISSRQVWKICWKHTNDAEDSIC
jgi:hypothetical protein